MERGGKIGTGAFSASMGRVLLGRSISEYRPRDSVGDCSLGGVVGVTQVSS